MATDRRLLAGALGIALLVAACGGSSASPSAPDGAASPGTEATEAAPTEVPAVTDEAAASEDTGGPDASFVAGGAAELEALLPDSVGGTALTKTSFDGGSIAGAGFVDTGELDPILSANGKTIADVRMAIATSAAGASTQPMVIVALQVDGLDASKLAELAGASAGAGQMTNATIGGKQVQQFGEGAFGGAMYIKDDVLYEILFADQPQLEEILSQLP